MLHVIIKLNKLSLSISSSSILFSFEFVGSCLYNKYCPLEVCGIYVLSIASSFCQMALL